jgi:hypothetical protein
MSGVFATLACECALLAACSGNDDVPAPRISSVEPDHAAGGAVVTLHGSAFCQQPGVTDDAPCSAIGQVYFGSVPGTPTLWNDATIAVEVPTPVVGRADVRVIASGRASNSVAFTAE